MLHIWQAESVWLPTSQACVAFELPAILRNRHAKVFTCDVRWMVRARVRIGARSPGLALFCYPTISIHLQYYTLYSKLTNLCQANPVWLTVSRVRERGVLEM